MPPYPPHPRHMLRRSRSDSVIENDGVLETVTDSKWSLILHLINRQDAHDAFVEHGITDLWLPLPKQNLRRLLNDPTAEKRFFSQQERFYHNTWPDIEDGPTPHLSFEDGEEMVATHSILGEGGHGIVEQVVLPTAPQHVVCVRKRIARPRQLRAHKQMMAAFAREVHVMRQVEHHHCVRFLGSYTDLDSLAILLTPVAEMDLAAFLDLETIGDTQRSILRRGINCLCTALNYLHQKKIRHEDLKPANVLIQDGNILLTDFGFSLDFSDDSISTTTGVPSAWSARYSAPEIMDYEARNRATDVWSLGCILIEMLSRLYGYRLSELKLFWKLTRYGHGSYSHNEEATTKWHAKLLAEIGTNSKDKALCFLISHMLYSDRLLRPSTQQVVDRLVDLDLFFPFDIPSMCRFCREETRSSNLEVLRFSRSFWATEYWWTQGYFYPGISDDFTFILADLDCKIIAFKHDFPTPGSEISAFSHYFEEPLAIEMKCRYLLSAASRTGSTKEFWNAHRGQKTRSHHKGVKHALLSTDIVSLKHVVFTRLYCNILLPSENPEVLTFQTRLIQISLLPVCFPRSKSYGAFFFMVSFSKKELVSETERTEWGAMDLASVSHDAMA